jgi:hypothetical protein
MPKGSTAKHRISTRAGVFDCPRELRETLALFVKNPQLLDGLPPAERELRREQIARFQAIRAKRSEATPRGHEVRRDREARRLLDRLSDPDAPGGNDSIDLIWATLSDRQQQLVLDWMAAHPEWPGDA